MVALLLVAALTYVGNDACRPCHTKIYASYAHTSMAQSSGQVRGNVEPGHFLHESSKTEYRIGREGLVQWRTPRGSGQRQLEYFIGSKAAGRSYLYSADRFLFQAPVTWYSQQARWDVSPGYERDESTRWSRAIEPNCLHCHASQSRPIFGTVNQYADPPFAQDGIGCERCHGPGSDHIAGRGRMINPAKLQPDRRDSVCAQCHLSGAARIEKAGKRIAAFRPGDRLDDYVVFFVSTDQSKMVMKAAGHVEKLQASACKQASGDKLWCGTCHDPHSVPSSTERATWYRNKCLTCHQLPECERGPDCAGCHMPRARVVDGGHGVLTDHSIPRKQRKNLPLSSEWKMQPFPGFSTTSRELGLGYAEASQSSGDRNQRDEAERLLTSVERDAQVLLHLANLRSLRNDHAGAAALWEAVLKDNPHSVVALVNLGGVRGAQGRFAEAERLWRAALAKNPGQMEAASNLVALLEHTGRRQDAHALRARFKQIEPETPER